ncbi:MAG TPA: hypothetical protein DDZ66_05565 [Firmicutes bacterium]|jgi:2-phosphosulfolactate phosphatase|nr:hypothetical protein [Bacillota bacterium]
MRADVILSPGEYGLHELARKTAIVIDVFRFTTTVLTALEAGMERFFPVMEIEEAWAMKERYPDYFLAGERQALRIPGFDFGNSPLEHHGKLYPGGMLVCSTTNGTRAIYGARGSQEVVLASLRSARAVASYVQKQGRDVVMFPAGLKGTYSLEDTWCAGLILSDLKPRNLGDGAKTARLVYEGIPLDQLRASAHGERLQSLGLHDDLAFCLELNASSGVIVWDQESGWGAMAR